MSVKRYNHSTDGVEFAFRPVDYGEDDAPLGEYVRFSDYAALQAKVERLTKAGIAMGMALPDTDEANAAYRSFERVVRS